MVEEKEEEKEEEEGLVWRLPGRQTFQPAGPASNSSKQALPQAAAG